MEQSNGSKLKDSIPLIYFYYLLLNLNPKTTWLFLIKIILLILAFRKLMIKKLQHIAIGSLAIFYMILSIGIEVDLHYCLGELKDIKVFNHQDEETKCCNDNVCSLERSFSCCDNEHLCYHIDDEQLTSKQLGKVNVNQQQGWLTTTSFSFQSNSNLYTNKAYLKAELEHQAQPAYLLNCAFIYYG